MDKKNTTKVETFRNRNGKLCFRSDSLFWKVSGKSLPYKIVGRRGDITSAYANTDKANDVLGWKAQSTLEEATSAWKWERK
jgi:UDP-glucose 4-epimerase